MKTGVVEKDRIDRRPTSVQRKDMSSSEVPDSISCILLFCDCE